MTPFVFVLYYLSMVVMSLYAASALFKHVKHQGWGFVPIVMMALLGVGMMVLWTIFEPHVECVPFLNGLFIGSFLFVVFELGFILILIKRQNRMKSTL